MNANFELSSLFEFILIFFFGGQIFLSFYFLSKKIGPIQKFPFFVWGSEVSLIGALILLLCLKTGQVDFIAFERLMRGLLGLFFANFTAMISFLGIEKLNNKKIRTLWRLPIIGFFAGIYFEWQYTKLICMGYFVVALFVLFLKRKYLHIINQHILLGIIPCAYLFYFDPFNILDWCILWLLLSGSTVKIHELICIKKLTFLEGK